jgi:PAS domain S-box-containing protein
VAAPDGATEYLNRIGSAYTGAPPEANYGWNWVNLVHPDDAERARAGWAEAVRTESPFALEFRVRRHDGVFRWHACRALPVRREDGRVRKWVGTATDIEDHRRLEVEAERSKRQALEALTLLETLQSAAPVGFAFVDQNLRLVRVNEVLADMAGMPATKLTGRQVGRLAPILWPDLETQTRRVLQTGTPMPNQEQSGEPRSHPGSPRHWLTSCYPVRIDRDVLGVVLVVADITEQKNAQNFRALLSRLLAGLDGQDSEVALPAGWTESGRGNGEAEPMLHLPGRQDGKARVPDRQVRPDRPFTPRERDVLTLLARGMVAAEVAESLGVDLSTVRFHVRHILEKLGVHSQLAAVMVAVREGLVEI